MDEMVDRLLDILADKLTERLSAGHKELYTAKELAERYGVSCATIRSKMAAGEFAKGKTVLMIAHRLSTVASADCIYVVQDGRITETGTKDELCAQNGLFARMWQDYQASVQWKVAKEG